MKKSEKENIVSSLHQSIQNAGIIIITQQVGLTVLETSDLRKQMYEVSAKHKVAKNKLAMIAIKNTSSSFLMDLFKGPTSLTFSDDPITAAKVVVNFSKKNDKLKIIGGSMQGEELDVTEIKRLASLPSIEQIRANIVNIISSPATHIARITQAPAAQLARLFYAYGSSEKH